MTLRWTLWILVATLTAMLTVSFSQTPSNVLFKNLFLEDDQDIIDGMLEDGIAENDSSDGNDLLSIELSHQPLAVAIWISTSVIPSGLPTWFGPVNRNQPTSIRVALHINQPSKVRIKPVKFDKTYKNEI